MRHGRRKAVAIVVFVVLALFLTTGFRVTVVHGDSMLPTYSDGQIVFVSRLLALGGSVRKGDVLLLRKGNDVLIKRVAYVEGQTLDAASSRVFYRVRDFFEILRMRPAEGGRDAAQLQVPKGYIVVLGDNARASEDSRAFGPIPLSDVIGRVMNPPPLSK